MVSTEGSGHHGSTVRPAWIIIAAGVSAALQIGKLPPALTVLEQQLDVSLLQAGFLLSTIQIAGMLLGLSVGLSADRWGLRRSMLCGLWLLSISSILGATATGFDWLLFMRALEGIGLLLVAMPAPGLIRRHVSVAQLSAIMGWWAAYVPLGSAVSLFLGPWVLAALSWQWWWLLLGAVAMVAALAVWCGVPADQTGAPAQQPTDVHWWPRLVLTVHSSGPWLIGLCFMMYTAQWISIVGFLPTMYTQAGLDGKLAGLMTALVAAVNIAGNVTAGKLLQKAWTARRCLQIGFVVMGGCSLLAFLQVQGEPVAPMWLRFAAILMFSIAGGLIPGSLFAVVMQLAPSPQTVSTTVGFAQQWSSFGQFVGPPLFAGLALFAGGWQWSWVLTGCFCVAGWLLAIGIQRAFERRRSDWPS